jgi:hypothetical protein
MNEPSRCCINISAIVLEMGDPLATPFVWLVDLFLNNKVVLP